MNESKTGGEGERSFAISPFLFIHLWVSSSDRRSLNGQPDKGKGDQHTHTSTPQTKSRPSLLL